LKFRLFPQAVKSCPDTGGNRLDGQSPHRRPCPCTNTSIRNSSSNTANATTHASINRPELALAERGFAVRDWFLRFMGKASAKQGPSYRESRPPREIVDRHAASILKFLNDMRLFPSSFFR
jgi:hypothetical protein